MARYGLDDNGTKRGWTELFAKPKCPGVPTVAADAIFEVRSRERAASKDRRRSAAHHHDRATAAILTSSPPNAIVVIVVEPGVAGAAEWRALRREMLATVYRQ